MRDIPIGERIRLFRLGRGMTQEQLAGLAVVSVSWLSQVERGARVSFHIAPLTKVANVLNVSVAELIGEHFSLNPPASPANGNDGKIDAIRTALLLGTEVKDLRPIATLRSEITAARKLRQASRYSELATMLPDLLAQTTTLATHATDADERRGAVGMVSEVSFLTSRVLHNLGEMELAWLAAERCSAAAEDAEAPLLKAAAGRRIAHLCLRGRGDVNAQARAVAERAATELEPTLDTDNPAQLSMWGSLLLTAAIAAARNEERTDALDLIRRARTVADRLGTDRDDVWFSFGPSNVLLHEIHVYVEVDDPLTALRRAADVTVDRLPSNWLERKASHLVDVARCHAARRRDADAISALLRADQIAPEEVRYHLVVREMVRSFLRKERTSAAPGLRDLAKRIGVA